jgi:hypothetical protein
MWLVDLLKSFLPVKPTAQIFSDNETSIRAAHNTAYFAELKHVMIRQRFVNQYLNYYGIVLKKVSTKLNLADICTKGSTVSFLDTNLERILLLCLLRLLSLLLFLLLFLFRDRSTLRGGVTPISVSVHS